MNSLNSEVSMNNFICRQLNKSICCRKIFNLFYKSGSSVLKKDLLGIGFNNPIGIASGVDINAEYYNYFSNFGASFVEIGPLTSKKQDNNLGARNAIENIKRNNPQTVLIGNIKRNKQSLMNEVRKDFETAFAQIYDFVDIIVISPSEDSLELCDDESLSEILDNLLSLRRFYDEYKPILLEIKDNSSSTQIEEIVHFCLSSGIEGIVTNKKNVKIVKEKSQSLLSIVATGDYLSPQDVLDTLVEGADLVALGERLANPKGINSTIKHLEKFYKCKQQYVQ